MTKISKSAIRDKSSKLLTDEGRWQALVNKDERADGLFWFSVKTTGVYCRPSCPARLPKRENAIFYLSLEDAEKAGFRACKRCDPKGRGLASQHSKAVATACRLIREAEKKYREGGTGSTIRFAIAECSLGAILVASSQK